MEDKFMSTFCKLIVWAIFSNKCNYFFTRLHPDAFKNELDEPNFPSSGLATIIPNIRQQEHFNRGSFQEAWKQKHTYATKEHFSTTTMTHSRNNLGHGSLHKYQVAHLRSSDRVSVCRGNKSTIHQKMR